MENSNSSVSVFTSMYPRMDMGLEWVGVLVVCHWWSISRCKTNFEKLGLQGSSCYLSQLIFLL